VSVLPQDPGQRVNQRVFVGRVENHVGPEVAMAVPGEVIDRQGHDQDDQWSLGRRGCTPATPAGRNPDDAIEYAPRRRQADFAVDGDPSLFPGEQPQGCGQLE
jgi:hypothetical protein